MRFHSNDILIGVDKNQLIGSHGQSNRLKHLSMERAGAKLIPLRLPYGDYIRINDKIMNAINAVGADNLHKKDLLPLISTSVDTKKNLGEVVQNICSKQHERFKRELLKCQEHGGRLVILIEEPDIETLEDVWFWDNPRLKKNPKATKGTSLYKSLCTIRDEYGVDIQFCNRKTAGDNILRILEEK